MKLNFLLLLLIPVLSFGQNNTSFTKLINETNHYLKEYEKVYPLDKVYSITDFDLSEEEKLELIEFSEEDDWLTATTDSVDAFSMIAYLQHKIIGNIKDIIAHEDFLKYDITRLIIGEDIHIAKSEDNKLFNFSIDEKTGGSYRSSLSVTYYTDGVINEPEEKDDSAFSFSTDGIDEIYTLYTQEGTKYVLLSYVRACNSCFYSTINLISYKDKRFVDEFHYSLELRDTEGGVSYDPETKTIHAEYYIDDLTPYCYCNEAEADQHMFGYNRYDKVELQIQCQCLFVFNGTTFELVKESWEEESFVNNTNQ